MAKIYFLNRKQVFDVLTGWDLAQISRLIPSLPLKFGCRQGQCGVCAIKITSGGDHLTKCSSREKKTLEQVKKPYEKGYRLACQCAINDDISILDED
jgi:ferredoxin